MYLLHIYGIVLLYLFAVDHVDCKKGKCELHPLNYATAQYYKFSVRAGGVPSDRSALQGSEAFFHAQKKAKFAIAESADLSFFVKRLCFKVQNVQSIQVKYRGLEKQTVDIPSESQTRFKRHCISKKDVSVRNLQLIFKASDKKLSLMVKDLFMSACIDTSIDVLEMREKKLKDRLPVVPALPNVDNPPVVLPVIPV